MIPVTNQINVTTANAGPDKRIVRKIWKEAVSAKAQLELVQDLLNRNLGFGDVEEFLKLQGEKLKSTGKENFKGARSEQISLLMDCKLKDAQERFRNSE